MKHFIMQSKNISTSHYVAWSVALAASSASIYFIEISGRTAATLWWVERMLILGIFLILSVGILYKDKFVHRYTVPFIALGLPVALYQQLLHWDIIKINPQACGVSFACSTKFFDIFGFISQATLCLTAYVVIAICMYLASRTSKMS